jgi:peptidylprolyl isomerase
VRYVVLVGALCAVAISVGCGGDSPEKASTVVTVSESTGKKSTPAAAFKRTEPSVEVPKEPAPKELVVNDLLEGTGAAAETGNELTVHEVAVMYKTGEQLESIYGNEGFRFELGSGEAIEGWERGLVGMRAGGRRELIIPSNLAYEKGPMIYVVDLLEVKKARPSQGAVVRPPRS